jgi:C1A family cysteine protease
MLATLFFSTAFASTLSSNEKADFSRFQKWVVEHEKTYDSLDEYAKRFGVFRSMLKVADKRNAENVQAGGEDNVHGVTKFSDLTQDEFRDTYLMKPGFYKPRPEAEFTIETNLTAGNVDWRTQGVVTAVKNQAQCGSCWAFSATEAVESFGQLDVNYGLTPLSAQQSCSCTYSYNGCNGGNPQNVYKTAIANYGGSESSDYYPYTMNCGTCGVKSSATKYVSTNGYTDAKQGTLQSVLDNNGPPSVCVAAESWNTYHSGVMTSCAGSIDHAVQAVGYTSSGVSTPYWIVRNSWGTSWGVQGYIYLAMAGDTCKVQDDVNYPKGAAAN